MPKPWPDPEDRPLAALDYLLLIAVFGLSLFCVGTGLIALSNLLQ